MRRSWNQIESSLKLTFQSSYDDKKNCNRDDVDVFVNDEYDYEKSREKKINIT